MRILDTMENIRMPEDGVTRLHERNGAVAVQL
jgi:hypothetical protein